MDSDEGIYLLASKLVGAGRLPYLDFFYHQTPVLPYVYGAWMRIVGNTWTSGRALSAILAAALGAWLFSAVRRQSGSAAAAFAMALYIGSADVVGWFTVVKTYALSALLLFAAHQFAARERWMLAGAALGATVDVRLYFAGLLPVFLAWLWRRAGVARFCAGFSLGVLPCLAFALASPLVFYFDNLGFHAVRTGRPGLIQNLPQKLEVLGGWLSDIQLSGPLIAACLFALLYRAGNATTRLALYLTLACMALFLLPSPSYGQYICVAVPLLIFSAVTASADAISRLPVNSRALVAGGFVALLIITGPIWAREFGQYFEGIAGMEAGNWKLAKVEQVSRAVDDYARDGEPILSTWTGYAFETRGLALAGTENDNRLAVAETLPNDTLARYRLISQRQIEESLKTQRIVVYGHRPSPPGTVPEEPYYARLSESGFQVARQIGDTEILIKTEAKVSAK